ncbi:hypothetical protein Pmar_PMAR002866 [Perkinsus marinus ATCC 50983]|uniref:Uncharacterized protein n=1 Tax=Perkinsus marinus (strain ATCC 50983 / TXsc) TaxID=423536 RepID=C5LQR4_PERM5|nr:hypothetical protein Pmar_PMAR002866 [Perkinsus marinus ATCC 50983]EER00799.1 hypothetical protein Pmar_PMAR002866 [Perkinsus marinus ATCC 50983]|eukprot:XP_002768081.1 hypothetical protein Pmar_PMAR002866 [Perkinsus marinus ATCC 50983]
MSFLFNLASSITSALEGDPTPASDAVDGDDSVQAKWDTTAVSKATSAAKEGADFFSALADSIDRDVSTYDVVEALKECKERNSASPKELRRDSHLSECMARLRECAETSLESLLVNQDSGINDLGLSNMGIVISLLTRVLTGEEDAPIEPDDAFQAYIEEITENALAVVQRLWNHLEAGGGDEVDWSSTVSLVMSRSANGTTFIRSLEVCINAACRICNSIVRQSDMLGLGAPREALSGALVHSPCAIGSLLGAIATLSTEDQLEVSELEPAPGRSNLSQPLVVAASSACLYQLAVNEGCRKYIIETGLLEPLVDLCRMVVESMSSEVSEEMGGVLASMVSCVTCFESEVVRSTSGSAELRRAALKTLSETVASNVVADSPEVVQWLSRLSKHLGIAEDCGPEMIGYAVNAMLTSSSSEEIVNSIRSDMMDELCGAPVGLAKYLCTAPEVVDSALQGWKMSPQRADITLRALLAAKQRQAEVAEIYFEGISSLVKTVADVGSVQEEEGENDQYAFLLPQALRLIFLWAAGSSYGGELHEYVCGEVGNSPILIPTLTRLASRIPNQGKKDVYISGLSCAVLGAVIVSGKSAVVQEAVETKVTVKTFVGNLSGLLQLKYHRGDGELFDRDAPSIWSDLQRVLDAAKKCFLQGLLSKAESSGNMSEKSVEVSTDSGNGVPSIRADEEGEEPAAEGGMSNAQMKKIVAGYQSIISAHEQELTELRKEVDRVHAENDKLKNSIQAQGIKMNEAGDCDATMALVDRVAKSLRGKIDDLSKQLAQAQAQTASKDAKMYRELLANDNERRTRMVEALGRRCEDSEAAINSPVSYRGGASPHG